MQQIPGQMDVYECIEIASLDALMADGFDVKEGTEALGNVVIPNDESEEPAQ